ERAYLLIEESCGELCSINLQKSFGLASLSIKIFQLGLRTKKEEVLKKICSWECMLSLELWVNSFKQILVGIISMDCHPLYLDLQIFT
ncbi:hypothetical protein Droror1_Dr00000171, partial [Drosera rotundifolia]